jgi:hypothetical protein
LAVVSQTSVIKVAFGSIAVIENTEPNFRKGSEAEIKLRTLRDALERGGATP